MCEIEERLNRRDAAFKKIADEAEEKVSAFRRNLMEDVENLINEETAGERPPIEQAEYEALQLIAIGFTFDGLEQALLSVEDLIDNAKAKIDLATETAKILKKQKEANDVTG